MLPQRAARAESGFFLPRGRAVQLVEHLQNVQGLLVIDPIKNLLAAAARGDQVLVAQDAQLLRQGGLVNVQKCFKLAYRPFPLA